jgi:flagellar motor switch protein FliN/FliY
VTESQAAVGQEFAPPAEVVETARPLRALAGTDRLDLLGNIEMDVTAELGRTRMPVRQLLALTPGTLVELDKTAGSPIDLLVNGTLIARGEVVVIDEEFGIRISEIVDPSGEAR